jgi:uncharacterized membrane protein YfcA
MLSQSMSQIGLLAAALLAAGAATGLLAGVFGVGGGAIVVPVLYWCFGFLGVPEDIRMPLCVGTSLAVIIPTSIRSYNAHRARGAADTSIVKAWAVPVVAGVLAGSLVARYAPAGLFKGVFAVVALVSAIRLLFGADSWRLPGELRVGGAVMRAYGFGIGVLSTLMGIGGGQLSNIFMSLYGRPIHQAIATSSGLGVLISIPGALGAVYAGWPQMERLPPLSLGYVSLIAFALVAPTSLLMAPIGARLAHSLSKRRLETAFGVFLLLVSLRFFASLLGY